MVGVCVDCISVNSSNGLVGKGIEFGVTRHRPWLFFYHTREYPYADTSIVFTLLHTGTPLDTFLAEHDVQQEPQQNSGNVKYGGSISDCPDQRWICL